MYRAMGDFRIDEMAMRYSGFVERLYAWCQELGFDPRYMMPSRAFCSDENQGYPTILLTKQFGTFPFNHGRVGGLVATDRHGAFVHHGRDLVLVHASHVGYDPATGKFGTYRRLRTEDHHHSASCGKLCDVLGVYMDEYHFARENVQVGRVGNNEVVVIDNALLHQDQSSGLSLHLGKLIDDGVGAEPVRIFSTSKAFVPHPWLLAKLDETTWQGALQPIGDQLSAEMFSFKPIVGPVNEPDDLLQRNLLPAMAHIVTSDHPAVEAACYNVQIEFDRTYRSLLQAPEYEDRNLLFISGLNVDISPERDMPFPLTKFIPWAAFYRLIDGTSRVLEQDEVNSVLRAQTATAGSHMALDEAIDIMAKADAITLPSLK